MLLVTTSLTLLFVVLGFGTLFLLFWFTYALQCQNLLNISHEIIDYALLYHSCAYLSSHSQMLMNLSSIVGLPLQHRHLCDGDEYFICEGYTCLTHVLLIVFLSFLFKIYTSINIRVFSFAGLFLSTNMIGGVQQHYYSSLDTLSADLGYVWSLFHHPQVSIFFIGNLQKLQYEFLFSNLCDPYYC